ncbi:hypothetical protein [Atlantibacter subterraneus]|uniref:transcriptional antitermination N peptide n=1 Tax=Atlantibacter subterraneus TaxID=255519 RepID=UPI002FDDD785
MTNREHKKLLRAIRHQQEKRDNQQFAKKIDRAFSRLSEDCSNRVLKATSLIAVRETDIGGSCCLPEVAMYAAGHRKSKDIVTAR